MPAARAVRVNATVALVAAILGVAVVFSLGATAIAIHGADPELPQEYHWEGAQFERDVALATRAGALDVRATIEIIASRGICRAQLRSAGAPPAALSLAFIHGTDPRLDRRVRLTRRLGGYEGPCEPLVSGHYHLELEDEPGTWRIRDEISAPAAALELGASRPVG